MMIPDGSVNNGSGDDGLFPLCHQAIPWTNADLLLIGNLGIDFNELYIKIKCFTFKKTYLKVSSTKLMAILFTLKCVNEEGHAKM